jgi:hypothetical protein
MAVATSRRLAGIVTMTIDGNSYDVVSDANYNPSTIKRETLAGQTRVEGFSEMPVAGYIGAVLRDNSAFSVRDFNAATDVTVVLALANGKMVYGNGMWNTELSEVKTQEGTFTVKFESDDVYEAGVLS